MYSSYFSSPECAYFKELVALWLFSKKLTFSLLVTDDLQKEAVLAFLKPQLQVWSIFKLYISELFP